MNLGQCSRLSADKFNSYFPNDFDSFKDRITEVVKATSLFGCYSCEVKISNSLKDPHLCFQWLTSEGIYFNTRCHDETESVIVLRW
jgi:hypothetical protein